MHLTKPDKERGTKVFVTPNTLADATLADASFLLTVGSFLLTAALFLLTIVFGSFLLTV